MSYKSIDDIQREKEEREREELKRKISTDINDVFGNLIKKRKEEKKKRPFWKKLLGFLFWFGLFLFVLNFVLGNIWLLKFFLKDLFNLT